jgi:hypothetical protein
VTLPPCESGSLKFAILSSHPGTIDLLTQPRTQLRASTSHTNHSVGFRSRVAKPRCIAERPWHLTGDKCTNEAYSRLAVRNHRFLYRRCNGFDVDRLNSLAPSISPAYNLPQSKWSLGLMPIDILRTTRLPERFPGILPRTGRD